MSKKYISMNGCKFVLDEDVFNELNKQKNENKNLLFNKIIECGEFISTLIIFISVLIGLYCFAANGLSVLLIIIISGVLSKLMWNYIPFYRITLFTNILWLIGNYIFRFMLHIITIIIIAFIVFKDWKIILFYLLGSLITTLINGLLIGYRAEYNHNMKAANFCLK